jgi:hypothetical protein
MREACAGRQGRSARGRSVRAAATQASSRSSWAIRLSTWSWVSGIVAPAPRDPGAWLVVAPWTLAGSTPPSLANDVAVGLLLMALSFRRGRVTGRFGSWDACVV